MWIFLTVFLAASAIKDGGAELRSACTSGAPVLRTLPGGTPVTIRYALSGQGLPCYKVTAETAAGKVEGYLSAAEMTTIEEFDAARKQAGWIGTQEVMEAALPLAPLASAPAGTNVLTQASDLIQSSRPAKALEMLEAELRSHTDPNLLAMAGAAAWRADNAKKALQYWSASLKLQPNPGLQELYKRVEREASADQSAYRAYGSRVLLRYEGTAVSAENAREMVATVDSEFARISDQLGCSASERIVVIAQSPDAYRKTTNTAEWSGGQFDGRIRVPVFARAELDANLRRTLSHEITHACLAMTGRWPSWFHEGVAQYMSGDRSGEADRAALNQLAARKQLPKLTSLGHDWSGMDAARARQAYALALLAIEIFQRDFSAFGLRNLLRNPDRLPLISAELDRTLAKGQ